MVCLNDKKESSVGCVYVGDTQGGSDLEGSGHKSRDVIKRPTTMTPKRIFSKAVVFRLPRASYNRESKAREKVKSCMKSRGGLRQLTRDKIPRPCIASCESGILYVHHRIYQWKLLIPNLPVHFVSLTGYGMSYWNTGFSGATTSLLLRSQLGTIPGIVWWLKANGSDFVQLDTAGNDLSQSWLGIETYKSKRGRNYD